MNLNAEQLKELEAMAGLFFSIRDIMVAIDIPMHMENEFSALVTYGTSSPAYIAYNRGRLTAETQLRQSIKQSALNGSNPAQSTMMELYIKSKIN